MRPDPHPMLSHPDPGAAIPVKCLLVDDLEENLLALSALLRRDDVELLQARSGREALELLLVHDVALALVDVRMPEMDGFELAELIRGSERTRHVPLVFVTADSRDPHRQFKGYESGAVDFLYKPIDPVVLKNKCDVFFQLHRQKLQLAAELKQRTETLRLNEMFMAVLGHDLRNPLSAIIMAAQALERRSGDPTVRDAAARIRGTGRRMGHMIDDLLDAVRSRLGGGIGLQSAPAHLGELVQGVLDELRTAHPGREIVLSQEGDLHGEWDASRLGQLVSNLVGNALQHGQADQPVQVHLDGSATATVSLTVHNAGLIPAELMPHLFDPFRGRQRASGRQDGLGLGLYIVQQIALAHRGQVEVFSAEPEGTRFLTRVARRVSG